jgi:hypothetical protein
MNGDYFIHKVLALIFIGIVIICIATPAPAPNRVKVCVSIPGKPDINYTTDSVDDWEVGYYSFVVTDGTHAEKIQVPISNTIVTTTLK